MTITSSNPNNLYSEGPVMGVIVMPPFPLITDLKSKNLEVPNRTLVGLIDTGCSNTCMHGKIAEEMGLVPYDQMTVHTPNGKSTQLLYDVTLFFQATGNHPFPLQVCGANLEGQPYQALIGRDFLQLGLFVYNGICNRWDLCI